ncbi:MAG: 7-carboxy-7-deazaguanine synthase QueE [Steroidobacteraceae bacterium]|jgi:7-carboxy-7-deazaguanine synthase|nr:7-carboxy-7-deazaguanine synthase QueE [Steroidobacteraceae bacterium]
MAAHPEQAGVELARAERDAIPVAERLRITEIFHSLQGEAEAVGWPTVFVRLTGCPLRCRYCDTEYSFYGGQWRGIAEVLETVAGYGARHVCVTGGEPLAQRNCHALLARLCDAGYRVSLETGGALDCHAVDARVARVIDVKTPGSGESGRNLWANLDALRPHDQVKFVICDRADYEWSRTVVLDRRLADACTVLFSPSANELPARDLAEWILADRLPVRFQLQLHKILWGNVAGR